jgi:hypothetical protein
MSDQRNCWKQLRVEKFRWMLTQLISQNTVDGITTSVRLELNKPILELLPKQIPQVDLFAKIPATVVEEDSDPLLHPVADDVVGVGGGGS